MRKESVHGIMQKFRSTLAILFFVTASAPCLFAASLNISPVRVNLTDRRSTAVLKVTNEDDNPVTVQLHTLNWQAQGTQEVYSASDEIFVNPPVATIPGHGTQIIRMVLRHPARVSTERSWRLLIEEVPPPPKPGVVRMLLNLSIPIFLSDSDARFTPSLSWEAVHTPDGSLKVTASNHGNAHVQIKTLNLTEGGSGVPVKSSAMAYVLPGGSHEWVFRDERLKNATHVSLDAETDLATDKGKLHEEIALQDK